MWINWTTALLEQLCDWKEWNWLWHRLTKLQEATGMDTEQHYIIKYLSQDQCFSKLPESSMLSLVHLRWGMPFVKCFWQTSTDTNYAVLKEGDRGINKKKINMSPFKITCRVKLMGAKWGLVTFRFLVRRVVFTENAAGSRGRETGELLLHLSCVYAVIYTITILWDVYCGKKVLNTKHQTWICNA